MRSLNQIEIAANSFITASLQEQNAVVITALGRFEPLFHPEYIVVSNSGDSTVRKLIPPHISLSFIPSEYILQHRHYTSVDFTPPTEFFDPTFMTNLADLLEHEEVEVQSALELHLKNLLIDLFRGRRTTLLEIGDLYISEEGEGNLVINFQASEEILKSLNFVFSAYQPVEISPTADFSDTEVRNELHENRLIQISIPKPEVEVAPTPQIEESIIETTIEQTPVSSTPVKEKKRKNNTAWLLLIPALLILGLLLTLATLQKKSEPVLPKDVQVEQRIKEPNEAELEIEVAPLDTITTQVGCTLAKLAREYYDNSYYWVYIYMANHEKIKDPNNLPIGQELIILPLEIYKLHNNTEEALNEAKEWATLIQLGTFSSYDEQRKQLPINNNKQSI